MAKIPEGLSEGKLSWVGAYDMCLSLTDLSYNVTSRVTGEVVESNSFDGQYCRISLLPKVRNRTIK